MTSSISADLCVIGAGSGGLSVAAGAAQLGLKTILIEKAQMGGDCLNTGCVPSKALLAAAKRAQIHRKNDIDGIASHEPDIDFSAVKDHVFSTIKSIEPNDSQDRFEKLGVNVLRARANFLDQKTVQADGHIIKAKYFVIATGSRAFIPDIPGLNKGKTLTNETIFQLRSKPDHLIIIGGGPIGIEMAQAHQRLGCHVTVIDVKTILSKDDPKNVSIVREALKNEGVCFHENTKVIKVEYKSEKIILTLESNDTQKVIEGSHLLAASGRKPNIEDLSLENAGILYTSKGITVDARLRTTNKSVYAAGDVTGGPQFTHVAGYHAGIIIRNICFKIPAKVNYKALPRVTFTDPEIAQAGLTQESAREKFNENIKTIEWHFADNDRAIAERTSIGQIRVITNKKGFILGASIVGPQAGELIGLWALALSKGMKMSDIAGMIAPYPTLGEISKRVAGAWYTPSLFSKKTRWLVNLLQKF